MRKTRWTAAAAAVAGVLLLGACGFEFSAGGGAVSADEVASQVSSELAAQVGYEPEEVACPEDLPAEVGASIRCELTHEGTTLGVTVTASAVEGGQVDFDIQVDDQPAG